MRDEAESSEGAAINPLGPYEDGRVLWRLESEFWSVYVEAMTLSGAPLSYEAATWLLDLANLNPPQA